MTESKHTPTPLETELLEALENLVIHSDNEIGKHQYDVDYASVEDALTLARAAIAKAKGEQP
jgi:hypothetical protein